MEGVLMPFFIHRVRPLRGTDVSDLNAVLAMIQAAEYTLDSSAGSLTGNTDKATEGDRHD